MRWQSSITVLLALGCLVIAGCVMPDQISQIQKDVADVQQQLRGIQQDQAQTRNQLVEIERQLGEDGGVSREDFADMQLTIDEVARNSAILDERVNEANRRLDRISQNLQEIRQLAGRAATPPAGGPFAPGEQLPGAGDPQNTGSDTAEAIPNPEALYNSSYADFSKGNYSLAISGFEEYSKRYPDSDLADNALYWVGECYFSQGRFREAVEAFDGLLARYPQSDRAPASNLKKGLAYLEQNQVGKAIVQLRYVLDTYPSSDESRIARDKLASLGATGRG